jgi:hypothetical protein
VNYNLALAAPLEDQMQIAKDKVVAFHYRLSELDGGPIEESHGGEPLVYLHGHGGLIPGLEKAMAPGTRTPCSAFPRVMS